MAIILLGLIAEPSTGNLRSLLDATRDRRSAVEVLPLPPHPVFSVRVRQNFDRRKDRLVRVERREHPVTLPKKQFIMFPCVETADAGGAPGLTAGIMQINVKIPEDIPSGDKIPLVVKVGARYSQAGVTVAIR